MPPAPSQTVVTPDESSWLAQRDDAVPISSGVMTLVTGTRMRRMFGSSSATMPRTSAWAMCVCESIRPGMIMARSGAMSLAGVHAACTASRGPTAAITPSFTATAPPERIARSGSMVTIRPARIVSQGAGAAPLKSTRRAWSKRREW